ncbi:MAG: type 4a pilus biogenesis protein PilO [Parcubacteria group bacterium]|nr:type 4a pilus biogenesis protein PilO [Parcubacteria group bacterium]
MELHIHQKHDPMNPKAHGLPLGQRSPWLWTGAAILVVSAAAFAFIVYPQWTKVGAGREFDTASLEQTYQDREKTLNQLKALSGNYEKIDAENISLLSSILPTSKAIPELLAQLEAIARQSGVSLTSVSLAEVDEKGSTLKQTLEAEVGGGKKTVKKDNKIRQMNVQMQVGANRYPVFKQLLEQLQSHTRLIDVESYLFASDQDSQALTLKVYYLPL